MIDRRELILNQLFVVLQTVTGFASTWRNRAELKTDRRPALVQLDGVEDTLLSSISGNRPSVAPSLLTLRPQVFILLKDHKPLNVGVGTTLNNYRRAVIVAVANNANLREHVTPNGHVAYVGCETDMQTGSLVQGEMQLNFAFSYPFKVSDLT